MIIGIDEVNRGYGIVETPIGTFPRPPAVSTAQGDLEGWGIWVYHPDPEKTAFEKCAVPLSDERFEDTGGWFGGTPEVSPKQSTPVWPAERGEMRCRP